MLSKKNKKGFTLMEMLIVVAIIAILIAIMIPTFNSQLEKSREAADGANIRAAYAQVMVEYLDENKAASETVSLQQTTKGWKTTSIEENLKNLTKYDNNGKDAYRYDKDEVGPTKGGTCTVSVDDDGNVSIAFATASASN